MIEEFAVVTHCQQNVAELEIERKTACSICGQTRGCGNATWGKLLGHKSTTLRVPNTLGAQVGDSVVVGIDERVVLRSVFFLYVIPLLSLVVFSVLADALSDRQLYVGIAACLGLLLGFVVVKRVVGDSAKHQAALLRFANASASSDAPANSRTNGSNDKS